jgi:hypothetical protein
VPIHIVNVDYQHDHIIVELSDGRTLTFFVENLLSLAPDETVYENDPSIVDDSV